MSNESKNILRLRKILRQLADKRSSIPDSAVKDLTSALVDQLTESLPVIQAFEQRHLEISAQTEQLKKLSNQLKEREIKLSPRVDTKRESLHERFKSIDWENHRVEKWELLSEIRIVDEDTLKLGTGVLYTLGSAPAILVAPSMQRWDQLHYERYLRNLAPVVDALDPSRLKPVFEILGKGVVSVVDVFSALVIFVDVLDQTQQSSFGRNLTIASDVSLVLKQASEMLKDWTDYLSGCSEQQTQSLFTIEMHLADMQDALKAISVLEGKYQHDSESAVTP